jgi:31-O-methyltransferase
MYQLAEIVQGRGYLRHGIEVGSGDVVLDVGANVGVAAAFFAVECGAGTVHSFEPVPQVFEQLKQNLRAFPACKPHPYGLYSQKVTTEIGFYPDAWAISSLHADPTADKSLLRRTLHNLGVTEQEAEERLAGRLRVENVRCELRTLSGALETEGIQRVDLLKIDVERAELDVLAGIEEADWPQIRQVAVEIHLDASDRERTVEILERHGFSVTQDQDPTMSGTPVRMLYAVRR